MDMQIKCKSLPPLVEGKIHGYLKLVIDEVIWLKKYLGEINVFVSWWGETDKARFRPADITRNVVRSQQEIATIYAICTNISLFEEYIKNCASIELVIISEETNTIVGTSQVTDLLEIFKNEPYFRYVPIINNYRSKIGELHISMKLEHVTKCSNIQLKTHEHDNKQVITNSVSSVIGNLKNQKDVTNGKYSLSNRLKSKQSEIYKSVLKSRRTEFQEPLKRFNNEVTDTLVAQVVARAQKLRGALLKETYNEGVLTLNDNSLNSILQSQISTEEQAKLHNYYLMEDMTSSDESKVLHTFRSMSSISDSIDHTSNNLKTSKYDNERSTSNHLSSTHANSPVDEILLECTSSKDTTSFNHIDYIRIFIKSFTLSPAGYRRVKSCSLSDNDSSFLSATYFVQYDMMFDYIREINKKWIQENKPIRICSKQRTKQVVYFDHNGIYGILKLKPYTEYVIKFKIFVRHINRKSLIELGSATMNINNVLKNENLSIAQPLVIVNKGIKLGELSVIVELASNSRYFGQQIDGATSVKKNIPIQCTQGLLTEDSNKRGKNVVENQINTNSKVTDFNDSLATKCLSHCRVENNGDKTINAKGQENNIKDKVLLYGLIYVAEGKQLPQLNTYLICRAFWRENKIKSQICNDTSTPFYHFHHVVPLIYDNDLLDRIKDNYIIIEVYCRNNNVDNLLGLAKLPIHQFYIAYRDSRVLSHLLLSKYPIIGIDEWVSIVDPVTNQSYGQLLALVALGTAEQIELLEMSKGLRTIVSVPHATVSENSFGFTKNLQTLQQSIQSPKHLPLSTETFVQNNSQTNDTDNTMRQLYSSNLKSQECQTDISTIKEFKFNKESQKKISDSEYSVLYDDIGYSTQVFNINKTNIDQAAQTEIDLEKKRLIHIKDQTPTNELCFNNSSEDSYNNTIKHNFHSPTNTSRSVGVGAEYNKESDQQLSSSYSNTTFNLPSAIHSENESMDVACTQTTFRAIVEIECALHLPKVEKANETIEPSTYVSFQANQFDSPKHSNSYIITNVFSYSCNPKWNWKCDTRLSTELLLHGEKRLILKIWRILDPDIDMQINLENDIVIGFSAIDLSILISGFPTVSGWFHIMDFTGKCNGQIKVCVTPLDNLALLGKSTTLSTTRVPICPVSQLNKFPPCNYEVHQADVEGNYTNYSSSIPTQEEDNSVHSENQLDSHVTHVGLEDMSMSFLSLSLKQKLTELDEITKRLELRLRDVTNTAFEDYYENDFDLNELNSDNENNDCKTTNCVVSNTAGNFNNLTFQTSQSEKNLLHDTNTTQNENQNISNKNEFSNQLLENYIDCNETISYETLKPASSEESSFCKKRNLSNNYCSISQLNNHAVQNIKLPDNISMDCPERGAKTHINYLLDKLSLQFPVQSQSSKVIPLKKNITTSLVDLSQNANNSSRQGNKCEQKITVYTVPTQTDDVDNHSTKHSENQIENYITNEKDNRCNNTGSAEVFIQSQITNKMSTLIREELVTEDSSNTSRCDELTTYLVTSNVRHMDLNNIFNPLLYQHLVPGLHDLNPSSEEEIVDQLDNRYSKTFNTSISSKLNKMQNLMEINVSAENTDLSRVTPFGMSENVNDSMDLTVLHKSNYNDLLTSNDTESTTTISTEKSLIKLTDMGITENSYSTSSETSVLSRQAPDGGNPTEDAVKPLIVQQKDEIQDSSSSSFN